MALEEYYRKRDFHRTREPKGHEHAGEGFSFVIQKHDASRLHYDFRLEFDGVLKSWAVPKGPSLDPGVKSLAMQVEDHPLEYAGFEGVIPEGQYGGGTVMVWDRGTWEPIGDPHKGLAEGHLKFMLHGEKLKGSWVLVQMKGREEGRGWLLIKHDDRYAKPGDGHGFLERRAKSVQTKRSLDQIARQADRVWKSNRAEKTKPVRATPRARRSTKKTATRRTKGKSRKVGGRKAKPPAILATLGDLEHARRRSLPSDLSCQLATATPHIPAGDDWLHEMKFDGYRILCTLVDGQARMISRNGKDWTGRFSDTAAALEELPVTSAVLDGEIVAMNEEGASDFQRLQNWLNRGREDELLYYVFDVLYLEGYDLRAMPLVERKRMLSELLLSRHPANDGIVRYSDHVEGRGAKVLDQICRRGLEGIVSKKADSLYEGRRTRTWLKTKCLGRQEFVIGGFTRPQGARNFFGALLVGHYEGDKFVFNGRVGTGFTEDSLADLNRRLKKLVVPEPAFANPPTGAERRGVTWVRPELVAEVEFTEWTDDGILRHPSFQGLREDKSPREVVREGGAPAESKGALRALWQHPDEGNGESSGNGEERSTMKKATRRKSSDDANDNVVAGVTISHPDRVVFPEQGLTKLQLARYYEEIADWVLPYVADRPVTLVRCPQGRGKTCFYQKHWTESLPPAVGHVTVREKEGEAEYVLIHNAAGLVSLVQIGVLELHPWGSKADKLDNPDRMIFDLDPDDKIPWSEVRQAARDVRGLLEDFGLESFVQTSGGKGLHVIVPLQRRAGWEEMGEFARLAAVGLANREPDRFVANMRKVLRKGKIYVDFLRNRREATAVSPYSTRSRPGAPVATPLRWEELADVSAANEFNVPKVLARLRKLKTDPWKGYFKTRQSITQGMLTQAQKFAAES